MDYIAEYRAARIAANEARERSAYTAMGEAAQRSDEVLDAADAAGVEIPIREIEEEAEREVAARLP